MKKMKLSFVAVALVAILSAFATSPNFFDRKFQVTGEGSDIGGDYWILGENVTGQTQGSEDYDCLANINVKCTLETDNSAVYTESSQLRVRKVSASTPITGTFDTDPE
jgi:hypothetical protein